MNQLERIHFLINELKKEEDRYKDLEIPDSYLYQTRLLRSLMNVRIPKEISKECFQIKELLRLQ